MMVEGDIVVEIETLHTTELRVAEVAAEEVCCSLATPRSAMVFGRTEFVGRIADKEALKRMPEASDNHAAGMKQPYKLDLLQRSLVLQSRMDMAADSPVAGNDSPPWLTISLW